MKLFALVVQGFASLVCCNAYVEYFYPPVFWQRDNCPFTKLQANKNVNNTEEFVMNVLPYTGMNIVCPNHVTVNTWGSRRSPFDLSLYENVWHVDREGYEKCEVNNGGKLMLVCDKPAVPKKLELSFHPIYTTEEPRFIPGRHYYFISTSRGEESELRWKRKGGAYGHCQRYHMKLHIYVCNPKVEDCKWELPRCDPPQEIQQRMLMIDGRLPGPTRAMPATKRKIATRKLTTKAARQTTTEEPSVLAQKIESPEDCNNDSETSIHMVLNFVLGGVIVFLIIVVFILAFALSRSKGCNFKKSKSSLPPSQSKHTIYESVPVQLPPVNMVPIGSPQADYLVYARTCTPDPSQHAAIRTPHHTYETPVFRFPDVAQRSRASSTQVASSMERQDDTIESAPV